MCVHVCSVQVLLFESEKATCKLWSSPSRMSGSMGKTSGSVVTIEEVIGSQSDTDGGNRWGWSMPSAFWVLFVAPVCECCDIYTYISTCQLRRRLLCGKWLVTWLHIYLSLPWLSFSLGSESVNPDMNTLSACIIGTIRWPTVPLRQCSFPMGTRAQFLSYHMYPQSFDDIFSGTLITVSDTLLSVITGCCV